MWRQAYDQYGDLYWYWDEYARATVTYHDGLTPEQQLALLVIVFLLWLSLYGYLYGRWPWQSVPREPEFEPPPKLPALPPPPPPIPDYSHEIIYWRNETRRMEAEMEARAKRAEQEEFEDWLRRRRDGQ